MPGRGLAYLSIGDAARLADPGEDWAGGLFDCT
jgi:hypothetical protein